MKPGYAPRKERLLDAAERFRAAQEELWLNPAETRGTLLNAESVANIDLTDDSLLGLRNETIACIQALAACNPNPAPLGDWGDAGSIWRVRACSADPWNT